MRQTKFIITPRQYATGAYLVDITAAATIVSSLATAASVAVALLVFRITETREAYAQARLKTLELTQNLQRLDNILSEPLFTEIAYNIAISIKNLEKGPSETSLIEYFKDSRNVNFTSQCIHRGISLSTSGSKLEEIRNGLERIPFELTRKFSVSALIFTSLIRLVSRSADGAVMPRTYWHYLCNSEGVMKSLLPAMQENVGQPREYEALAVFISGISAAQIDYRQKLIDQCRGLTTILVDILQSYSDGQLRKHSALEKNLLFKAQSVDEEKHSGDLDKYFRLIRAIFSDASWERVVQYIALIREAGA